MNDSLSVNTEIASYFIWEYTRHSNALSLWYCAEDIGFFLEKKGILHYEQLNAIIRLPKNDRDYIDFVRHIAYRIYVFTANGDDLKNWFIAEKLLCNGEWVNAILNVAVLFSRIRSGSLEIADTIRTEKLRRLLS